MTVKRYRRATHRLRPPEETLSLVTGHLEGCGIWRCADLTGLDRLGIPVHAAFTPQNPLLQISWGKGAQPVDAAVSARMEAIERFHATLMDPREQLATAAALTARGQAVVFPHRLQRFDRRVYFTDRVPISWIPMEVLHPHGADGTVMVPAAAIFPRQPRILGFTANGLASGNCIEEAQLHALYEILERHGISSCFDATGRLTLRQNGTRRVALSGAPRATVGDLAEKVRRNGLDLVLLHIAAPVDRVHLFWAALIDPLAPVAWIRVNIGYGAHASAEVAAVRAITEAAQSRLAYLHGCREDMGFKMRHPNREAVEKTARYFASFSADLPWEALTDHSEDSLAVEWQNLLAATVAAGFEGIYRLPIPSRVPGIAVVKLVVEGTRLRHGLF